MDKKYSMEEFMEIVGELRSEHGCPWDKAQTHVSLRPCMMEEAVELLNSIKIYEQTKIADNMCEELGDILLQVALHSQIAKEEGLFSIEDVITGISEKMLRRHPHVFGNQNMEDTEQIRKTWDEIKKEEKAGQAWVTSPLREIPQELPSLTRAVKVIKKVEKELPGENYQKTLELLQEQTAELVKIDKITEKAALEQKIADILMSLSRISMLAGIQQEQVLYDRIESYIDKYDSSLHK